jgi:hypothetical protein
MGRRRGHVLEHAVDAVPDAEVSSWHSRCTSDTRDLSASSSSMS